MATRIAVRIPDAVLAAVDDAVRAGRFESRAAAVREGLERVLPTEREREIAESYRRVYPDQPEDERFGRAGEALLAERIKELERSEEQPLKQHGSTGRPTPQTPPPP